MVSVLARKKWNILYLYSNSMPSEFAKNTIRHRNTHTYICIYKYYLSVTCPWTISAELSKTSWLTKSVDWQHMVAKLSGNRGKIIIKICIYKLIYGNIRRYVAKILMSEKLSNQEKKNSVLNIRTFLLEHAVAWSGIAFAEGWQDELTLQQKLWHKTTDIRLWITLHCPSDG